jgi:hypothetical protein
MAYQVHTITELNQLQECEVFHIKHDYWVKGYQPKAFGRMGFLKDYGIVISMTAMEKEPLRTYTQENDPVYMDSGLEAFLCFSQDPSDMRYLNFEMNANGAMLSAFGTAKERSFLAELTQHRAVCEAILETSSWSVLLKIPKELICNMYQREPLQPGDSFTCNFYKICETSSQEHYLSYAPLKSDKPNFHLPEFFEKAVIIK